MKLILIHTTRAVAVAAVVMMTICMGRAADDAAPLTNTVPLTDAIAKLARQAGFNYILDPHVPGASFGPGRLLPQPSVNASWTNATALAALSALLQEQKLMMVTNPATTVARIASADMGVQPVTESQVGTNNDKVIPMVSMQQVPLTGAVTRFAAVAELKINFAPEISSPAFDSQGTVSFRWERLTARQALAALLDNYDLEMIEDAATSTARVALKATTTGASDVQASAEEQSRFLAAAKQASEKRDTLQTTAGSAIALPESSGSAESASASATNETDSWSAPTNGLQARITLVENPRRLEVATRWIVPYLELRNVRDLNNPLEVRCDRQHIQFELVDAAGNVVTHRSVLDRRSGPVPDIGTIILPLDSSIRISMECRNWGVPRAAAMISTDSGAWVIQEAERGQVFLGARVVGDKVEGDRYKIWHGTIETPLVKVDWK